MIMKGNPFAKFAADLRRGSSKVPTSVVPSTLDIMAERIRKKAVLNIKAQVKRYTGALARSGRVEKGFTPQQRIIAFGGQMAGGNLVDYAKVIEFGRYSRAPFMPKPYLRPAVLEEMKLSRKDIKRELEKSLREYKKHYGFL